ncbi:MAG: DNA-processing protein DprA [Rhodoglobus sp.]
MFGLKEAQVAEMVRAVTVPELEREEIEERFARAAWSGITEPGDSVAGEVVEKLGAARALAAMIERWTPKVFVSSLGSTHLTEDDAHKAFGRWIPRLESRLTMVSLRQAARFGARLRVPGDESWPEGLSDLGPHAPLALWTRGTEHALMSLSVSISLVGARAATGYGEHIAMESSAGLVDRGYAIVSGAAYGIDGMAHRAALASKGQTIAFLAGGVDRFYPSGHDALLSRIVEQGMVISELPCGSSPTRWRFLQRNRLIAAASLATVVLEAGWRSGSLNTAHHALCLSRPVGAVPGPVTSAASAGCHRLIRENDVVCVTTAGEMAELAPFAGQSAETSVTSVGPETRSVTSAVELRMLDALSPRSPRTVDDLAARSGLSITDVRAQLGRLQLADAVSEHERGWTKRAAPPKPSSPSAGLV